MEIVQTQQGVNVSWQSNYTGHLYLRATMDYEVLLQELPNQGNKVRVTLQFDQNPDSNPSPSVSRETDPPKPFIFLIPYWCLEYYMFCLFVSIE